MNADAYPLIKALLWAGIEDYCPLWQALWEINTLIPDLPAEHRLDVTRRLVQSLLEAGDAELVWCAGDSIEPIAMTDAPPLLNDIAVWAVLDGEERQVCLSTTDQGQKRYRALT
ncbi:MAG TPA: hypothetical protein VHG30_18340 [Microvirga sp.]|nr:hypothetical protein [Microvirga sp.]